jgi:hypothetical protein
MRKAILLFGLLPMVFGILQAEDSAGILKKIDAFRIPYKEFLVRTKITAFERDRPTETAVFDAYISGQDKSLVIAKEYKTWGMKILFVDEDMWVQLPDTHRPLRITPIQRLMGEASNGDIAQISLTNDYTAEEKGLETVDGTACRKILLTARRKSATYQKIILFVREADYRSVKAEFYLTSGKHFKTAFYMEYKPIGGRMILSKTIIVDELQNWKRTELEYTAFEEKTIPARYFNKNNLIYFTGL